MYMYYDIDMKSERVSMARKKFTYLLLQTTAL